MIKYVKKQQHGHIIHTMNTTTLRYQAILKVSCLNIKYFISIENTSDISSVH